MKLFKRAYHFFVRKIKYIYVCFFDKDIIKTIPPYNYVENITRYNIHKYLNLSKNNIKSWCIVGGYLGLEIPEILKNYPNSIIDIFECSKVNYERLEKNFINNKRVNIIKKAVSNKNGKLNFFENSLPGTGSILRVGELAKAEYFLEEKESFEVEAITLDSYFINKNIDVLQIDVQGAEKLVLEGSKDILKNTKSILVEISVKKELYKNGVTFKELEKILYENEFSLVLLGTDFNLTGNALYIRNNFIS